MIPVNPGNILPFYEEGYSSNDRRWQRHRQIGTDLVPYGLPCPRTRLLPFQFTVDVALVSVTTFALVNAEDDSETIVLDPGELEYEAEAGTNRHWITWKADTDLSIVPDCGYWYVFFNINSVGRFVSEVLYCTDFCGFETVDLQIEGDSCSEGGGNIQFTLEAVISAGSGTTYTIERKTGLSWNVLETDTSADIVELLSAESREYRIQATTQCGLIITKEYEATWDSADGCNTLTLTPGTVSVNEAGILSTPPVWRLNFSNTTDKADVLYQTGYKQYLYLPLPIWDVPEIERQTEIKVNGLGQETRRFTRTVERHGFEVADIPDFVLGWLTKSGDLDTIKLEDAKLIDALAQVEVEITNLTFESPGRQGTALNVGRLYFDAEAEAFQGCQENWILD